MELIIIKTDNSQPIKKLLQQKHINYEAYNETQQNWITQEKLALQEWEKLSDEELVSEWEKIDDNEHERKDNWN